MTGAAIRAGGQGLRAAARAGLRALALAFVLAVAQGVPPALAETLELSRAELRARVAQLVFTGQGARARPLAEALVADDPDDFGARLLASYAARDAGAPARAAEHGGAAWDLARDDGQRHAAAMAMAQAKSSGGARSSAQFWLRRAAQVAPDAAKRKQAIRDFKYVRARNPWAYRLDFGLSPSSNINGGAASDTIWLFGLPFTLSGDSQALSGLETRLSFGVERTVQESAQAKTVLGTNLAGRFYQLSSEARALAPDASGSDYNFTALEAYLGHRRKAGRGGEWDGRLTLGHNRYGGAPMSTYLRFDGGRSLALAGGQRLRFGVMVENQNRLDAAQNAALLRGASVEWSRGLGPGVAHLGARLSDVASRSVAVDHVSRSLSLSYDLARPVLGAALSLSASYETRDYGAIWTTPGGREDHRLSLGARALLREMDYMGFAPELGLNYSRNRSNSVLHDSREIGLSLGVKSTF